MPSPFPGMDPYLEVHWRDVHARLIIYASDALQGVLPNPLRARVEERVVLETPEGFAESAFFPDVRVIQYPPTRGAGPQTQAGVAMMEPIIIEVEREPFTEGYIEIIDRGSGNEVVTIIEFLSPSNKILGPNRDQYLRKQKEICQSKTNLVEIDLNRTGGHVLAVLLENVPRDRRTPYMACVRRVTQRSKAEVYSMPLWHRLPVIKVPLRPTDADVPLDLQALVEQCYRNGAYEGTLNYSVDPEPPLLGAGAEWADEMLRGKELRPPRKPGRGKGKRKSS